MTALDPLGDRAFLAHFGTEAEASRWADSLRSRAWPGVVDVVPAFRKVAVVADPDVADLDALAERLAGLDAGPATDRDGARIVIPVLYDGADLAAVARTTGLDEPGVIAAHSGADYRVYAIGFQPGFPYAGDLPLVLSGLPRRPSPRARVPAGSVAVVGRQTAVYPGESPGGWHLLGRTPLKIVDVARGWFPIRAGDRLRFTPIDAEEFEARQDEPL